MKTVYTAVFCLLITILHSSCDKKEVSKTVDNEDTETEIIFLLERTEYTGCFNDDNNYIKDFPYKDTIYYELLDDTLKVHINMIQSCGHFLKDSILIDSGRVDIYTRDTTGQFAFCECDYIFDYYFIDFDSYILFNVYYKELDDTSYTFWGDLVYSE